MRNYPSIGIQIPSLLIPNSSIDFSKWAVIACDQFTSQPDYWSKVNEIVGQSPSTLHLILPEVYLGGLEEDVIISKIYENMRNYIRDKVLVPLEGMILVERTTHTGLRRGLILALDLEKYNYRRGSSSLIRATEETILERLPPRVQIRENALLELPHILVLIDDPERKVIEPLWEGRRQFPCIYDFDLMLSSGHLKGYQINDITIETALVGKLEELTDPAHFKNKYQLTKDYPPLLFAVGDGNHSLAAAKAVWEKKKAHLPCDHPLRYALVEIENIHDPGLIFEPIHRVLFGVKKEIQDSLISFFPEMDITPCSSFDEMKMMVNTSSSQNQIIGIVRNGFWESINIKNPHNQLPAGSIQTFLDNFMAIKGADKIDYIHGDDVMISLCQEPGNIGFYLPAMKKGELFKTIILEGALPRKTFSMGEASDKRFYFECRQIQYI